VCRRPPRAIFAAVPLCQPLTAVPLSYTVREGLSGFHRAKFAAITATSALTVALVLIGLFGLVAWQGAYVVEWLKQRVGEVEVFLSDAADARQTEAVRARLLATNGVERVTYVSREEASEEFRRVFGDEAALLPDEAFLPASFRVQFTSRYANPDSLEVLAARFSQLNRVDEVVYQQPLLAKVQANLRVFTPLALGIGLVVVVAALFLVGNTIRLTVYARRMLIRTMKLVGATNSFIRRPFLVEGVVQGAAAGVLACLLLGPVYSVVLAAVPQLRYQGWPGGSPFFTLLGLFLLGLVLGWLGSWIAVRRFIRSVRIE
jgi:cell division transport system permease protein